VRHLSGPPGGHEPEDGDDDEDDPGDRRDALDAMHGVSRIEGFDDADSYFTTEYGRFALQKLHFTR
jgi:hypothetical protein